MSTSQESEGTYRNVMFTFEEYACDLHISMFHKDIDYLQEAINNGNEWFVFPDRNGDSYYIHLSKVRVIRIEPRNKAF